MTKLTSPIAIIKNRRAQRAYDKMIAEGQAKLAETTPVSYTRIYA
jgi:hypothetical protein